MPEPVLIAIVAIVGGVIGSILSPLGQDYVNREQHKRQELSRKAQAAEDAQRHEAREAVARLERSQQHIQDQLIAVRRGVAGMGGRSYNEAQMRGYQEARTAAADINDPSLIEMVGKLHSSGIGSSQWEAARGDVLFRVGELQRETRESQT